MYGHRDQKNIKEEEDMNEIMKQGSIGKEFQ